MPACFTKDSLYLYEQSKEKRFDETIVRSNKVSPDSLVRLVKNVFSNYNESHLQKYLSERDSRKKAFENLRSIVVRKNGNDTIILFGVNGITYSDEDENLPDKKLEDIIKMMSKSYTRYLDIKEDRAERPAIGCQYSSASDQEIPVYDRA